ncbi:flagellin [Betaproteobacteria bacterium]|nr:flagellin [Betaproteobacteria bacterium]
MSVINTNIKSLIAQDTLTKNTQRLGTAMERLSTGKRINSAADDATGLAIATRLDAQTRGLQSAIKNANDSISTVETAEGAMQEVTSILQRMRELAIQSASDTNSDADREFLQNEIDQLSTELDRIASTTQYNGINVLDGSYANKVFQIGANAGQTMNISVGSMASSVLGVATSNSASVSNASTQVNTSQTVTTGGATAKGTNAVQTVVNLQFLNNSGSDTYSFKILDSNSGLTAEVSSVALDMTNSVSKDAFVASLNLSAATGQTDTVVTGANAFSSTIGGTLDLTSSANYGKVRFAISVDGGATTQIDLRDKLISTTGVTDTAVTQTQIVAALDSELERLFDARVGASATSADKIQIEDQSGRRVKVTQGAGDGTLFGTDAVNNGGLLANETIRNNLTFAFDGDNLVATNTAGGKVALSGYAAASNSQVLFDTVTDSQSEGVNEPILLATATANPNTMATATYSGNVENSSLSIRFSDRVGTGSTAQYSFKITDGAGHEYGSVSDMSLLSTLDNATIQASVLAALSTGISSLAGTDSSLDINEFEVTFSGDQLIISNSQGRALAVENFSSTHGFMTVTPINEPGASQILASQNAYFSETRIQLNTSTFGQDLSADNTNIFQFSLDGVNNSAALTVSVNGSAAGGGLVSGTTFAASVQAAIRATDNSIRDPNTGSAIAAADLSNITVQFDADTAELVFRDSAGRAMGFSYGGSSTLTTSTGPLLQEVTGASNKGITVQRDFSGAAQGDVINASEITLAFSTSDAAFNFTLNGKYLDGASTNSSAAMANAVSVDFGTDTATLQNKLNSLMTTLNGVHPEAVFEYTIDQSAKSLTLRQRDGGEILLGGFVTASTHKDLTAALTTPSGQGTSQTMIFQNHDKALLATAIGTQGVATAATLTLSGDDVYSMTVSDGTQSYTASNIIVDIDDANSTNNFGNAVTEALLGSGINVTMDTSGNVFFRRSDGGDIILQSFSAAQGSSGVWTPNSGQGTAYNLTGGGSVAGSTTVTTSSSSSSSSSGSSGSSTNSGTSIANMSIATQTGANSAITTIDAAISYVQAERSNLGAIQNRLTYTVDNLTNAMTNAASARSRVLDTDYAKETAELARAQIIQQAATAMLAQANQQPQIVLALLQ